MAERTRIAREMHDVLAHRISLLALARRCARGPADLPPEKYGKPRSCCARRPARHSTSCGA
jgi:hypothetical protein